MYVVLKHDQMLSTGAVARLILSDDNLRMAINELRSSKFEAWLRGVILDEELVCVLSSIGLRNWFRGVRSSLVVWVTPLVQIE
ncbi:hypothetical protein Droror1_Dr00025407 [Drosera rotundifolia]